MTRAVVDINVLVSAVVAPLGPPRRVVLAWEARRFRPIISPGMLDVLDEKLQLPRIVQRFRLTGDDRRWIYRLLDDYADRVSVGAHEMRVVTGDPEDDYVLATARIARADWLVTGDKGLLALGTYEGTQIVSPRECLGLLGLDTIDAS